ncbi:MAG TPA: TetR/AcrR family transcriptional regulator [Methylomusa anaerophila]|uniref:HTH-type transcriptional regulator TtgR n=1 Tax=Methylomusa anaerophila TaxID=1930071 RepID=A0A348AEJ5_9FIRM|nr:TetR/AcrR family transcriptional regulator [Methylomusa anaerophila]BBB89493.1 HTH-type transcriptional regulator TtgR [Methylomusa anaerophila]HML89724.1 TetR/AcrR family transcriptional regulator [Methylomusa anaerophila]
MTKSNITIAALRLFLLRGYKYVSLVEVGKEAGVTKGGIYHYFADKKDLLNAAVQCLFDHITATILSLISEEKSIQEILTALIVDQAVEVHIVKTFGIEQETFQINHINFMFEVTTHFPQFFKRVEGDMLTTCEAISLRLQKAVADGEIRADLDINALTTIIFTLLQGQRVIAFRYADRSTREQIVANICRLLGMQP